MTIKELIQELQTYPQDMFVVTYCNDNIEEGIEFRVIEEYYNGDSANPNCEIVNNVLELI